MTTQSIPHTAPRFRSGLTAVTAALGVLVAITVASTILALTGANHTTVPTPMTASQAAASSTPQTRYLGPRQQQEAIGAQSSPISSTADASNLAAHCLGDAQRCLR